MWNGSNVLFLSLFWKLWLVLSNQDVSCFVFGCVFLLLFFHHTLDVTRFLCQTLNSQLSPIYLCIIRHWSSTVCFIVGIQNHNIVTVFHCFLQEIDVSEFWSPFISLTAYSPELLVILSTIWNVTRCCTVVSFFFFFNVWVRTLAYTF